MALEEREYVPYRGVLGGGGEVSISFTLAYIYRLLLSPLQRYRLSSLVYKYFLQVSE